MDSIKKRKSIQPPAEVYNPFAYRTSKAKETPGVEACEDFDSSNSSLDFALDFEDSNMPSISISKRKKPASTVFAVKVLSLLLVGFAAGLLYHLVIQSSAAPVSNTTAPDDGEFLTDDLVKKLAMQNQFQQTEIEKLKKQLLAQEQEKQRDVKERKDYEDAVQKAWQEKQRRIAQEQKSDLKPRRVFDMSNPKVAQARLIGYIDEETGQFVQSNNLRGRNRSERITPPSREDQEI